MRATAILAMVLERGREVLDPGTVRVLEENIRVMGGAIREAREALVQDPGSKVLRRLLSENLRTKLELLRHATVAVLSNT